MRRFRSHQRRQDVYILDESIGLKSIKRRPTNKMPMMTRPSPRTGERFSEEAVHGYAIPKAEELDLKFINAFFSHQASIPAKLGAGATRRAG